MLLLSLTTSAQAQVGTIRGAVFDADFDAPVPAARVVAVGTSHATETTEQGTYALSGLEPGTYTLVFSKSGYVRQVRADVVVSAGLLTDVDVRLAGDFEEMAEFVVQDVLAMGGGSEAALLQLRFESPALMDSVSADLMSQAGASDAAGALALVSGATVQDGKFAVIRGLPDRYVSSQMNGVRLPSADENKRAVELDQFPSAVIDSIQVSKTFTPDQQGDASGGAVNVILKGIPEDLVMQFKTQYSFNDQVRGQKDFLTYSRGGEQIQYWNKGQSWSGDVGVSTRNAPQDFKVSAAMGGKEEIDEGVVFGGFGSAFYERDSSYFDNGVDNQLWVETPGQGLVPEQKQKTASDEFATALFDVTRSQTTEQYGGLGTVGLESEDHRVGLTWLYTYAEEDTATLAEDTRGKAYFFPGYDPSNPQGPGNDKDSLDTAPYIRTETLEHTERSTGTMQLKGEHILPFEEFDMGDSFHFEQPVLDWTYAKSTASLDQPDKRQFGSKWFPSSYDPGNPVFGIPPSTSDPIYHPFKPEANTNFGNVQRIFKSIDEDSDQYALNVKLPFDQWSGDQGYMKLGVFNDQVEREFRQDTFSNANDNSSWAANWSNPWSGAFPGQNHPITGSTYDVDYDGDQEITAWYWMADMPLNSRWKVIGGARYEQTDISVVNDPDPDAFWFPPGALAPNAFTDEANVDFDQRDVLPSLGVVYEPDDEWTVRASYSQTIARQTFKELTPVIQQEFLGGPIFIGNPELEMSSLKNYDLRVDYRPAEGSLISASWFKKDIDDAIEYVQDGVDFTFTTAVNYPEGELDGIELEFRQELGSFWESAEGLSFGANATFINAEVTLPSDEAALFNDPGIKAPTSTRDMTNAPEHLYNLYMTYDFADVGTQVALFYTVKGDTLVAGAGISNGNYIPNVYETEVGVLNASIAKSFGEDGRWRLQFQAKNLLNPDIEEVYRSDYSGPDATKTSYTRGREYSLSLSGRF